MSAWTTLGLLKLFLDILDDGPWAIVKGILVAGLPKPLPDVIDAGELIFMFFDLNGHYRGTKVVKQSHYRSMSSLKLKNQEQLNLSLATYDFPQLAKKQLATMEKRRLSDPKFPRFD